MNNEKWLSDLSSKVKASAAFKKDMADKTPKAKQAPTPPPVALADIASFSGWTVQRPKPARALGTLITRWRRSKATVHGADGYWAAWTQKEWAGWLGCSVPSFKLYANELANLGLLEREPHKHNGTRTIMFYRPTPLALKLTKGKADDWKHLGIEPQTIAKPSDKLDVLIAAYQQSYEKAQGVPLAVINKAEKKALSEIAKALPDNAAAIVQLCVEKWLSFASSAGLAKGYKPIPDMPSASHMWKNLQAAVEFMAKHKAAEKSAMEHTAQKKALKQAIPPKAPPQPKEPKATLEEILAINMGEYDDD